jgi:transcriptional regulator GlxA family with amidase domain
LQLIHRDPTKDWALSDLARDCGMSRAVLSERFSSIIGQSPMRYLALWRMQLAGILLLETNLPVEAVAPKVGYRSEAAFIRAFKSILGDPPGAWRRAQRANG